MRNPDGFPVDDPHFEEVVIKAVEADGRTFSREDGWSFGGVPDNADIVIRPGMVARFYGKGIGYSVRGLFIDGQRAFYRTEAEEHEYRLVERFGRDAAEWLARWDANEIVWSVSMGGFGPGYEQCIQITTAEVLRHLLASKYDEAIWAADADQWKKDRDAIDRAVLAVPAVRQLGLSGAQWGAAFGLARVLWSKGPRNALSDEKVKDRLIQVTKHFPGA